MNRFIFTVSIIVGSFSAYAGSTPCTATDLWAEMLEPEEVNIGTTSSDVPDPDCGDFSDADEWFSFECPPGGDVAIQLYEGSITNAAFTLYSGECDELTAIRCVSDYLCGQELMPAYFFEDLDPGETYYLRIWNEDGPVAGTLDIIIAHPSGNPYITTGDATEISFEGSSNCIQLTAAANAQVGCAWYPLAVDFTEAFEHQFSIYLGDIQGQAGADGMSIIYQVEDIPTCGQSGGSIGYGGLPNSLGIEFDSFINGPPYIDLPQDHTAISINGNMFSHISGPVGLGVISDGQFHQVEVAWDPATQLFQVWFDDILVHDINYDIVNNVFGGETMAYWGVSASTGGSVNQHVLCFENLELEDLSDVYTSEELTLCDGESVFLEGELQTEPGTYVDVYPAANGCDSTHTTELDFFPSNPSETMEVELCPGDVFIFDDMLYDQTGEYEVYLEDRNGCDSLVILDVLVEEFDAAIVSSGPLTCGRDSVELELDIYNGQALEYYWSTGSNAPSETVSEPGGYWLDVSYGDDCIWSEAYEVEEEQATIERRDTLSLCVGGQISWEGYIIDEAGEYETTVSSGSYCDTLLRLRVNETDYIPRYDTLSLCPGDSIQWEGLDIDSAGQYEKIILAGEECDTLAQLEVEALDYIRQRDTLGLCPNDSLTWKGLSIDSVGSYELILPAATGCDTLAQLWIMELERAVERDSFALCPGESRTWRGITIDSAGSYFERIPAAIACDTFAYLTVSQLQNETKSDTLFRCEGDTLLAYGESWDTAGVYSLTLPSSVTCDTLLELVVIDQPRIIWRDTVGLCPGEDTLWRGQNLSEAGEYSMIISASTGCDTLANLVIEEWSHPVQERFLERCHGNTLMIANLEIDTAGTYETYLSADSGCDTLLRLQVEDVPLIETSDTLGLCPGKTVSWRGESYDSVGNYEMSLSGTEGCDTLARLTVLPLNNTERTETFEKCAGRTLDVYGESFEDAGMYELILPSSQACDTVLTLIIEDSPLITRSEEVEVCEGETYLFRGRDLPPDSTYTFALEGAPPACDTLLSLTVSEEPLYSVQIEASGHLCQGSVQLTLDGPNESQISRGNWSNGATGDSLTVQRAGRYFWSFTSSAGCEVRDEIVVEECLPCESGIPNVFSPNGDGVNDVFTYSSSCQIQEFTARVYDRWGNMITESRNPDNIWDGGDYGVGVYVFQIEVELEHGGTVESEVFHGSITLVR